MLPVPAADAPPTLDTIERTLAALVRQLRLDPRTRGRPEILPTAMLWAGILRGQPSQRAVWRAVTGAGLWAYAPVAVTPEAVRKRIAGLGAETIQAVFTELTGHLVLVFLGAYRADRSKCAYRLITITTSEGTWRDLTNLRQPHQLGPAAVVALYARRWDIELAFKLVKRDLGLHLIWATTWPLIQIQIWATLLVAQVALVLRLQVALRAGVALFDVSLTVLLTDLPQYVAQGHDDVIGAIVARGRYGGIIRPSRRKRYDLPPDLPVEPLPPGLRLTQVPRNAGKT